MFKKAKDAVIALGCKAKNLYRQFIQTINPPVVSGEFIGKGAVVNQSRRAFFRKSAFATVATTCLIMLPSICFAAVDVAITTAISDALADVATVGSAVFGVLVAAAAFRWLRRTI